MEFSRRSFVKGMSAAFSGGYLVGMPLRTVKVYQSSNIFRKHCLVNLPLPFCLGSNPTSQMSVFADWAGFLSSFYSMNTTICTADVGAEYSPVRAISLQVHQFGWFNASLQTKLYTAFSIQSKKNICIFTLRSLYDAEISYLIRRSPICRALTQ